ncbi:MAG: nitroreductase family protein [Chloroflexota bacterium]
MDVLEAIRTRRSIRRFQSRPISKQLLQEIVEAATWAPSARDRQNWYFVVVGGRDKEFLLAQLYRAFHELARAVSRERHDAPAREWIGYLRQAMNPDAVERVQGFLAVAAHAPVILAVYSDVPSRLDPDAPLSVAAAIQNLFLAAHARGIGGCWMTAALYVADAISRHLGVVGKELIGMVLLGYPDELPQPSPRWPGRVKWLGITG